MTDHRQLHQRQGGVHVPVPALREGGGGRSQAVRSSCARRPHAHFLGDGGRTVRGGGRGRGAGTLETRATRPVGPRSPGKARLT